jgi:elongation factor Tu
LSWTSRLYKKYDYRCKSNGWSNFSCFSSRWCASSNKRHVILAKEIGIPYLVVFINKIDVIYDKEMIDIIELEIRELVEKYGFSEKTPVVRGSAKRALEGDKLYLDGIRNLMNTVDDYIKNPDRILNAPFILPVETVLVAKGRGTVVTGRVDKVQ